MADRTASERRKNEEELAFSLLSHFHILSCVLPPSSFRRRMLRRLASATGHALRSSLLLEGSSSSTTSLLEASPSSSLASAASRFALSSLASSSGRSPSSSLFSTLSAPAQAAAAGLADFIEPPLKEGEKRVAGELVENEFAFFDQSRRPAATATSTFFSLFFLSFSLPLTLPSLFSSTPNSIQQKNTRTQTKAAPGQQLTCAKGPGTTSTRCGSSC